MISDVRDVIFQADPFDFQGIEQLTTFLESPDCTMETCRNYREWIEAAFGPGEVAEYRRAPLSCCAITIGPAPGMLDYLGAMAGLIGLKLHPPTVLVRAGLCRAQLPLLPPAITAPCSVRESLRSSGAFGISQGGGYSLQRAGYAGQSAGRNREYRPSIRQGRIVRFKIDFQAVRAIDR